MHHKAYQISVHLCFLSVERHLVTILLKSFVQDPLHRVLQFAQFMHFILSHCILCTQCKSEAKVSTCDTALFT